MKITLDIPNEHAPALLALLSDLMPVRLEPQADPAEGHPELPLAMPVAEWVARAGKTGMVLKHIGRVMGDEISLDAQPDDESEEVAETRWAPVAHPRFAAPGIDAADPLKVEMEDVRIFPSKSFSEASTVAPIIGERFWMRNGEVVKVVARNAEHVSTEFEAVNDIGIHYYYNHKGKNCTNVFFDLVQQCPF